MLTENELTDFKKEYPLIYREKFSDEFADKILSVSETLNVDPNHLIAAMAFETGATFSPSIRNKLSGAVGLIQFMPRTANLLGTTDGDLAEMTQIQQMDYVQKYFLPYRGRLKSLEDLYMCILWPRAIGRSNDYILFGAGGKTYLQNKGLDLNKDGYVTKKEAAARVREIHRIGIERLSMGSTEVLKKT